MMKNAILLLLILNIAGYVYAQNEEVPNLLVIEKSDITGEGDTINGFFAYFDKTWSSKQNTLFGFNLDLDKDFSITARFKSTKNKSVYGIGFINAYGGNTAGFLINQKGEYNLYLLFDGSSCLLNGSRSYEGWKKSGAINKNSDETNFLMIDKKEQNFSVYINEHLIESYTLKVKLGDYFFTDYGILINGENPFVTIQSFSILGTKKNETN
jgi:hypothetical protein